METNKCSGLFGVLFGHNFQAVFHSEESPADQSVLNNIVSTMDDFYIPDAIDAAKPAKTTYVKHVCKRCGQIL